MLLFKYKAMNSEGKLIVGLVEAVSEGEAVGLLEEKGIKIVSLVKKEEDILNKMLMGFKSVKNKDIVTFARQFSILISANITLVKSLRILVDQLESPKFKMIISEVASEVDAGERLSDSLTKRPEVFSPFFINVIRSGETSGKLDEVLNYLADELEKDYDLTSKIKGAMIYPIFVFFALLAVGGIMMIFVVPKLTAMMRETGGELPMATQILIFISDFLVNYWYMVIIGMVSAFLALRTFYRSPVGKDLFDTLLLKSPVFGNLFNKIYIVRFARSLNTLLIGGVTISKGLKIVSEVVDNNVYKKLIQETVTEVEDGNSISSVFEKSEYIPKMVPQMIQIGEKTGKLDVILMRIVDFYSREINNIVANLMTLMEPVIMILMGVGVGIMVAAIIMPMYQMTANM